MRKEREKCFHSFVFVQPIAVEALEKVVIAIVLFFGVVVSDDFVWVEESLVAEAAEN
jgi:hypothetical protein